MSQEIWVLADEWRGTTSETTFESLALGRELADALGAPLVLVKPDQSAPPLEDALKAASPRAVLVPMTNPTLGLSTQLSARLEWPAVNFCRDIRVVDGQMEALCVLYGGKIETRVGLGGSSVLIGVWPGARPPEKGRSAAPREVAYAVREDKRVRLKKYLEPEAGDIDISQQDVLVAVGRGIQNKDNLEVAEELAAVLGGAVCGSRPVIDQGWLPLSRQVGKSGHTVKPRLYVALGISGAPEHVEGMRDSSIIVAVNTDAHAPIFRIAHYGVVGDAMEMAEALGQEAKSRKGSGTHA